METDAGLEVLKRPDPENAKALFDEAGRDFSKPIVALDPADNSIVHPLTVVTVQARRDIGLRGGRKLVDGWAVGHRPWRSCNWGCGRWCFQVRRWDRRP